MRFLTRRLFGVRGLLVQAKVRENMRKEPKQMKAKLKVLAMCGIVALLVLLNVQLAYVHDGWWYCWHKGSTLGVWCYGSNQAEAIADLNDEDWTTLDKYT